MTDIPYETPAGAIRLPFTDRRPGIKAAGVILIVLGAFAGCVSAVMPAGMFMASVAQRSAPATAPARAVAPQPDTRGMVIAMVMYVAAAVVFVWCGIGALRLRRWVRPVMLVVAWTWAVTGIFGTVFSLQAVRGYRDVVAASMPPGAPPPPAYLVYAMVAGTLLFSAVCLIGLPLLLVWLFQRRGVRQTLEYFDPRARWTDRCPTPVLAVSFWLVLAGASLLSYVAFGVLPLFGTLVTGAPAIVGIVVEVALFFALARWVYLLRPLAWWGTLVLFGALAASMVLTFARVGVEGFYGSAGYTSQQIEMMKRFGGVGSPASVVAMAVASVLMLGYLIYVRRYFVAAPRSDAASG